MNTAHIKIRSLNEHRSYKKGNIRMNTPKLRNLTKEKIVTKAIELLEKSDLAKLSMRTLAVELAVQVSALYNHFKNKQELIIALQAYYLNPQNQHYPINYETENWQNLIQNIASSSRLEFTTRPYVLELFATHASDSEQSSIQFENYLTKMSSFGFNLLHAAQISQTLYTYIVGFCNFENGVKKSNVNIEEQHAANIMEKYPQTHNFLQQYNWNFDRDYEFGIQSLIRGFTSCTHETD